MRKISEKVKESNKMLSVKELIDESVFLSNLFSIYVDGVLTEIRERIS